MLRELVANAVDATQKMKALAASGDCKEELGDLLLQVIFYAQIAAEDGYFTLDDVMNGLGRKLVRRHPHVFGDEKADSAEEALQLWYKIKAMEKEGYR